MQQSHNNLHDLVAIDDFKIGGMKCKHDKMQYRCMLCWELGVGGEDLCRTQSILDPTLINISTTEQERINDLAFNDIFKRLS